MLGQSADSQNATKQMAMCFEAMTIQKSKCNEDNEVLSTRSPLFGSSMLVEFVTNGNYDVECPFQFQTKENKNK